MLRVVRKRVKIRGVYQDSENWYLRGTVRGIRVDESTGTGDRQAAEAIRIKREAEVLDRSVFGHRETLTFAEAAVKYMQADGERRFLTPIIRHFKVAKVDAIDQEALDEAARKILPKGTPATRNRQVYTPTIAVLRYAKVTTPFKRPKVERTSAEFAEHEYLEKLLPHCNERLAALLTFMFYTGRRIGDAVKLDWQDVNLQQRTALIRRPKNGKPIGVYLTGPAFEALANLDDRKGKVFGYPARWSVYKPLKAACKAAGVSYISPHKLGRHSFATHALRAGAGIHEVMRAGGWESIQSMMVYAHVVPDDVRRTMEGVVGKKQGNGKASA